MKELKCLLTLLLFSLATATSADSRIAHELGDPVMFRNDISGTMCRPLIVEPGSQIWVAYFQALNVRLVFRKCEMEAGAELWFDDGINMRSIRGYPSWDWYQLREGDEYPSQIAAPLLNGSSNPSFCGNYMAYWASGPDQEKLAMLHDLGRRELIDEVSVGKVIIASDFLMLKRPVWDEQCVSVRYADERFLKDKEWVLSPKD